MHYITNTMEFQIHEPTVVTIGNLTAGTGDIRRSWLRWDKCVSAMVTDGGVYLSVTPDAMVTGKAKGF